MATIETPLGLEDHNADAQSGDGTVKPDGTAATGASGHAVANLADPDPGTSWRSSSATDVDDTVLRWQAAARKPRSIGAMTIAHHNLSEVAQVEFVADAKRAAGRTVELREDPEGGPSTAGDTIATTSSDQPAFSADVTALLLFRLHPPLGSSDYGSDDTLAYFGGTSSGSADFLIGLNNSQGLRASIARAGGAFVFLDSASVADDDGVSWTKLAVRIDGSATRGDLLINGTEDATSNSLAASPSGSDKVFQVGRDTSEARFDVALAALYSRYLTDDEISRAWDDQLPDCELEWRMEGTGTTVTDESGENRPGTITGGAARAWYLEDSPDGGSGVIEAHGPWRSRVALDLDAGVEIKREITATSPRSMQVRGFVRLEAARLGDTSSAQRILLAGHADTDDLRLWVVNGELRLGARGQTFVTSGVADGLWHPFMVEVNGRDDTYVMAVDGSSVATGACTAHTTKPSYKVELDGWPGVSFSDVVLTGYDRGIPSDPYRPPTPWEDPLMRIHLPLTSASTVKDVVTDTTVAPTGTPLEVLRIRDDSAADDVAFRPGAAGGVKSYASPLADAIDATSDYWAAVTALECAVAIWDPLNPDGYIEIGHWGLWSTLSPAISRVLGRRLGRRMPKLSRSPANVARAVLGAKTDTISVSFDGLVEESEALELHGRLSRARGMGNPVVLFSDTQSLAQGARNVTQVYGYLDSEPVLEERTPDGWHSVTVALARKEIGSWR